ncbi:MAG: family 1 glycosylhydrolase, partial [Clostridia bacterium]|nr:family 1 glycosylhydrolase [Clostridia bacterium]
MKELIFPENFEGGAATAAFQIEGGREERGDSVWDEFCEIGGKIKDGSNGDVACDHYHRYKEDVALMKTLGLKNYRFSVSWPRVMPDGERLSEKG